MDNIIDKLTSIFFECIDIITYLLLCALHYIVLFFVSIVSYLEAFIIKRNLIEPSDAPSISLAIISIFVGFLLAALYDTLKNDSNVRKALSEYKNDLLDRRELSYMLISTIKTFINSSKLPREAKDTLYASLKRLKKSITKKNNDNSWDILNDIEGTINKYQIEIDTKSIFNETSIYLNFLTGDKVGALYILYQMDEREAEQIRAELDQLRNKSKYQLFSNKDRNNNIIYNENNKVEAGSHIDLRRIPYDMKLDIMWAMKKANKTYRGYIVYVSFMIGGKGGLSKHPLHLECRGKFLKPAYKLMVSKRKYRDIEQVELCFTNNKGELEISDTSNVKDYSYLYTEDEIEESTKC